MDIPIVSRGFNASESFDKYRVEIVDQQWRTLGVDPGEFQAPRQDSRLAQSLAFLAVLLVSATLAMEPNPDQRFFTAMTESSLAAIEAGRLASAQASAPEVRAVAGQIVNEEGSAQARLALLAAEKGVVLPSAPDGRQRTAALALAARNDASFDAAYIENAILNHAHQLELLQGEIDSGRDAEARAFAMDWLPVVSRQLSGARKVATAPIILNPLLGNSR
jgi:putative membrane protein